uniref:DUF4537 domain-containing protein n=1 Tax=Amphimedon queenslandica TaxID=400682 RepID=A0A1X7TF41_AMPQE
GLVPRHELYSCPQSKVEEVIEYIKIQEKAWVGKPVIARKPTDYLFYPGVVLKQKDSSQDFVIRWSDNTTHTIEVTDMFGELTRRRPLYTDDYVIALPEEDDGGGVCYPGKIIGVQGEKLIIQLHNNKLCLASFEHCFWISDSYYQNSVLLIERVKEETNK